MYNYLYMYVYLQLSECMYNYLNLRTITCICMCIYNYLNVCTVICMCMFNYLAVCTIIWLWSLQRYWRLWYQSWGGIKTLLLLYSWETEESVKIQIMLEMVMTLSIFLCFPFLENVFKIQQSSNPRLPKLPKESGLKLKLGCWSIIQQLRSHFK